MNNLPKIQKIGGNTEYLRSESSDCIFPRGEHPDTRTDQEFLRDLENKLFIKRVERKASEQAKRKYVDSPVMCIQNGKTYPTARAAELDLSITRGGVCKNLNGERKRLNYRWSFIRIEK